MYHAYREASRNPQKEHLASAARAASHIPSLSFTFLIIFVLVLLSSPFSFSYHLRSRTFTISVLAPLSSLFSFPHHRCSRSPAALNNRRARLRLFSSVNALVAHSLASLNCTQGKNPVANVEKKKNKSLKNRNKNFRLCNIYSIFM